MEKNTRQQIEACLLEMLKEKSYHNISIAELCRRTGISRKTFYYHYADVKEAVEALTQNRMNDCSLYVSEHAADYWDAEAVYGAFLEFWMGQGDFLESVHLFDRFSYLIRRCVDYCQREEMHILSALLTSEIKIDEDVLNFLIGGLFSMVIQWHLRGYDTPVPEMTQKVLRLLHEPLMQNVSSK